MAFTADKVRQGVQKDTGYSIDNSLRLNDDDSAYLSRTPSSAGNRSTWTWSGWVKRGNLGLGLWRTIFAGTNASGNTEGLFFHTNDSLLFMNGGGSYTTSALYRDCSSWYHFVAVSDNTQAAAGDRMKLYVNGVLVTAFSSSTDPSQSATSGFVNDTRVHYHFRSDPMDGYLAEVHFIDGQALDHTSFGETGDYGEWKPIEVTGMTYGTNGFYLDFSNSGSLGTDASSNTNNWTVNNLAATDQMLDSPTNNFCTMNPNSPNTQALSQGNLHSTGNTGRSAVATQGMTTGKWYWEFYWTGGNNEVRIGATDDVSNGGYGGGIHAYSYTGNIANYLSGGNTNISCSPSMSENSIIGWAWDADIGELKAFVNGTAVNSGAAIVTGFTGYTLHPHGGQGASGYNIFYNFGQDSTFHNTKGSSGSYADSNGIGDFYYTPPSGFLALCTSNLPDPAVIPSEHFNTVLYTGNGSSERTITGVGFQPDMLWSKVRSNSGDQNLMDSVRGSDSTSMRNMNPNLTSAESTNTEWYKAIASDGFITATVAGTTSNWSGYTYVVWNWKANGTGVSNTNGSITSTVSANADAGFSIVSYTGNGTNPATVGHGLSSAPEMIIIKKRSFASDWTVYHAGIASDAETDFIELNTTGAASDDHERWNDTAPSSTVWTMQNRAEMNGSGGTFIAYCFHSVDGYSKMGSYTGNGSADGTFVYTGFAPKYVMIKQSSASVEMWNVFDDARSPYNLVNDYIKANDAGAERVNHTTLNLDFTSNGFKIRGTNTGINTSGATYIFLAFAEQPFKHSNAR